MPLLSAFQAYPAILILAGKAPDTVRPHGAAGHDIRHRNVGRLSKGVTIRSDPLWAADSMTTTDGPAAGRRRRAPEGEAPKGPSDPRTATRFARV